MAYSSAMSQGNDSASDTEMLASYHYYFPFCACLLKLQQQYTSVPALALNFLGFLTLWSAFPGILGRC